MDHLIQCPNCATSIAGNFCHGCGQAAHLHVPSAREFLHEFIAHYVALEGKLWKSVALLLFRPGRLTRDYIEGKRARYVEPLRLYLTFSIIFFAIFKLGGVSFGDGAPDAPPAQVQAVKDEVPDKEVNFTLMELEDGDGDRAQKFAASIHPLLGKKVGQFTALPKKDRNNALLRALSSYSPYAIFALMPVFAALLKLLYLGSGRRYGEHLLFALHTNAFAFLMLGVLLILPNGLPLVGPVLMLWLVFYLPTAMRKVYGGARLVTALRWLVLLAMHLLCIVFAIAAAAALAVIA
ncbi:DUF3667 domain-containing protein [Massilia sp. CMS3.1]|uniref:DUF3667 domain-containing protein n=1 Tax=Massilia sp. CMS3.1 TaxID=3373083 RepID=UPI003EE622D4